MMKKTSWEYTSYYQAFITTDTPIDAWYLAKLKQALNLSSVLSMQNIALTNKLTMTANNNHVFIQTEHEHTYCCSILFMDKSAKMDVFLFEGK